MAQDISQLLECQICSESYDEIRHKPKMLPCCHTFCLTCMRQLAFDPAPQSRYRPNRLKIKCPNDNKLFEVPFDTAVAKCDVANFPNDLTMMALLGITAKGADVPVDYTTGSGDIKNVLERRIKKLQREAIRVKNDIANSPLSCENEVKEARESIRATFQEMKDRFVKAIEDRQDTLMAELDSFSEKQKEKRSKELLFQLNEVTEFCNNVKRELSHLSEEKASQYLVRCFEMSKKTESTFQNLKSDEKCSREFKAQQVQFKSEIRRLTESNAENVSGRLKYGPSSKSCYDINQIITETGGHLTFIEPCKKSDS